MLVTIVGLALCCNHVMDENVTHEARCVRMGFVVHDVSEENGTRKTQNAWPGFVIRLQSHRLQLTQVRH